MWARFLILGYILATVSATIKLRELYSWNVLDWNYPNPISKQRDLESGALNPKNALPVGIERWRNKLFVTVPRWFPGMLFYIFLS